MIMKAYRIMKKPVALFLLLVLSLYILAGCGGRSNEPEASSSISEDITESQNSEPAANDSEENTGIISETETVLQEMEIDMKDSNQIKISLGDAEFTVTLENNESAQALKEMLTNGAITLSCSNYGGFEKVCRLGVTLPSNDTQITTTVGDVMLYSSNQIVIFYASNSWAYTRLGRVDEEYIDRLEEILSGNDTEITLSLMQ